MNWPRLRLDTGRRGLPIYCNAGILAHIAGLVPHPVGCKVIERYDSRVPPKISPWLAEVLRRERGGKGWSVVELARRADVDRSHLGEIEAEKRAPSIETLEKLCDALGITLSALFAEAERRREQSSSGS